MRIYKLNKMVVCFTNSPGKFLNPLASNTLDKPRNAFLDRFGKIVSTFDQIKVDESKVLIVIEKQFQEKLVNHLEQFLRFSETRLIVEDYNVYFDLEDDYKAGETEFAIPQKKGKLIITNNTLETNVSESNFTLFRLRNNIPVHGTDYDKEMILNVSEEFVSFVKGCYLGQEIIGRVHTRSKPPKKLVVRRAGDCTEEQKRVMTSKASDGGSIMGFLFIDNI